MNRPSRQRDHHWRLQFWQPALSARTDLLSLTVHLQAASSAHTTCYAVVTSRMPANTSNPAPYAFERIRLPLEAPTCWLDTPHTRMPQPIALKELRQQAVSFRRRADVTLKHVAIPPHKQRQANAHSTRARRERVRVFHTHATHPVYARLQLHTQCTHAIPYTPHTHPVHAHTLHTTHSTPMPHTHTSCPADRGHRVTPAPHGLSQRKQLNHTQPRHSPHNALQPAR